MDGPVSTLGVELASAKVLESSLIVSFHAMNIGDRLDCGLAHTLAADLGKPRSRLAWGLPA